MVLHLMAAVVDRQHGYDGVLVPIGTCLVGGMKLVVNTSGTRNLIVVGAGPARPLRSTCLTTKKRYASDGIWLARCVRYVIPKLLCGFRPNSRGNLGPVILVFSVHKDSV